MKLGLLVVMSVAVLLASFSESRIVSKCELKEKLDDMLSLPEKLQERTLATVICEVQRRSGLNTNVVTSFGLCIPSTTGGNNMTTAAATAANTNSTTIDLTNTTIATNTSTNPTTANSTISSGNTTSVSNLYGLFQLPDIKFCDSGYCPSKNMCHLSCTAFTDDDITDDIACVISTGYWKEIVRSASESCRGTRDFFEECN